MGTPSLLASKIGIAQEIVNELERAETLFPVFNSAHEGYAVIAEELDELWQEVKVNKGGTLVNNNKSAMRSEAIQVAAMAARFVLDICDR